MQLSLVNSSSCLSVFDHFVELAVKGLTKALKLSSQTLMMKLFAKTVNGF